MAPNWFIAFPMQVERLRIDPPPPPRVRLFATSDLHLTLAFLGSIGRAEARRAWARIGDFPSFRPVSGAFTGVEPLGQPRKPSALAAIVDRGRPELGEMILAARAPLLSAAGAQKDTRAPLPHMTLARIQRRANADERRTALSWAKAIDLRQVGFSVSEVALYTWAEDRQECLFQIAERHVLPG